jgi:hypothetical protein
MIAPAGICGRAAAASVSAVYNVVVDEGGAVQEFDYGGETNCAGTIFSSVGVGEQQQRGAQALAASTEKIAGDFAYRLVGGGALARELLFYENEVVANQIKNLFNRQKRDGTSPWAGLAACEFTLMGLNGLRNVRPGDAEESPEISRGGGGEFFWR